MRDGLSGGRAPDLARLRFQGCLVHEVPVHQVGKQGCDMVEAPVLIMLRAHRCDRPHRKPRCEAARFIACGRRAEYSHFYSVRLRWPRWSGRMELRVNRIPTRPVELEPTTGMAMLAAASSSSRSELTPRPESERIEFLLRRDGREATRGWVGRTLTTYRNELSRPGSYACDAIYRPRFERAVREFEDWLAVAQAGS